MISKKPFQLSSSILGLSAPADSDVGVGRAPGREANFLMRINHFYLEQSCVLMYSVLPAYLRLSKLLIEFSPFFARDTQL